MADGGNTFSSKPNYEPIQKELSTYLQKLSLQDFNTQEAMRVHIHAILKNDMLDATKFPLFNAIYTAYQKYPDKKIEQEVGTIVLETVDKFVEQKKNLLKQCD